MIKEFLVQWPNGPVAFQAEHVATSEDNPDGSMSIYRVVGEERGFILQTAYWHGGGSPVEAATEHFESAFHLLGRFIEWTPEGAHLALEDVNLIGTARANGIDFGNLLDGAMAENWIFDQPSDA